MIHEYSHRETFLTDEFMTETAGQSASRVHHCRIRLPDRLKLTGSFSNRNDQQQTNNMCAQFEKTKIMNQSAEGITIDRVEFKRLKGMHFLLTQLYLRV